MNVDEYDRLLSYIALSAPATRRPAEGDEPFLRPEIGFTPRWFRKELDIDFGRPWHTDPAYRMKAVKAMAGMVRRRFGALGSHIGIMQDPNGPLDILTGTHGALVVSGIYGVPTRYSDDDWPWAEVGGLGDEEADALEPPDLDDSPFWRDLLAQLDWIKEEIGPIHGFLNWQGVLNNSYRLRGSKIFSDMLHSPERVKHVFECVTETMLEGVRRLYRIQRDSGVEYSHCTISNCMVNMLSPRHYENFQLPFDSRMAEAFRMIGVHNCAWNADPYLDHYASLRNVAYIDMGMDSDLAKARELFPKGRRAIMYLPGDTKSKSLAEIRDDLAGIARRYGPCDMVFSDIDAGTPDSRVFEIADICRELSLRHAG